MTKVRYNKLAGALNSRGFNFDVAGEYEVPDDVAHYLVNTFKGNFEFVVAKKIEVVVKEPIVEEQAVEDKPTVVQGKKSTKK